MDLLMYPSVKLLLPLVLGIAVGDALEEDISSIVLVVDDDQYDCHYLCRVEEEVSSESIIALYGLFCWWNFCFNEPASCKETASQ